MSKKMKYEIMPRQLWQGIIHDDVIIRIMSVSPETDTVNGEDAHGDGAVLSYVLSTFTKYYRPEVRSLARIARDISLSWPSVWFGAVPYLQAMSTLDSINDTYGMDSAESIVQYFLANAATWRGPDAKRIKQELKYLVSLAK